MNIFSEYASWVKEIEDFYLECKEHDLALYDRFMPIYEVLNYIYLHTSDQTLEHTDDIDKIFQVGFEYLHDQVENAKMYLDLYFHNDFHQFMEYDSVLALLFYLEDVRYELSEKKIQFDEKEIVNMIEEIEKLIQSKRPIPDNYVLFIDDRIKKVFDNQEFNLYGIIDIFIDVAETLGVYLYEDDEILIGKDI